RRGMIPQCSWRCCGCRSDETSSGERTLTTRHPGLTMIDLLSDPQAGIAFLTLTGLELVLGIDNIIFISILVDKLPPERRDSARRLGPFLALFMRIALA